MEALVLNMENEQQSTLLDSQFRLKDIIQLVGLIIGGTIFVVTMNAKIDRLTDAVTDLKDSGSKTNVATDLRLNNLQNQVSANSVQIQLIQKDLELMKKR